jgi:hypothetical protein
MSISTGLRWAVLVLAAVATGILATRPLMRHALERQAVRNGPWGTSVGAGSADANFYLRSFIAVAGLYALAKEETVYYTAFLDGDGRELDGRCDYRVTGRALPARWWSLTLYGADHFLVENSANVYSRHADNLELAPDGTYAIAVSAREQRRNWLPAPAQGEFSITLRLYNPAPSVHENLATLALPAIDRGDCR